MRLVSFIAALAAPLTLLSFVPGSAQTLGSSDFAVAKQEAETYSTGLRIANLLQQFDDPSSFEPVSAAAFSEYGRSGTSYFYVNMRYACKINIGFNSVLPVAHGYTIENVDCCTRASPFICKKTGKN
jgi:hypothetical protein